MHRLSADSMDDCTEAYRNFHTQSGRYGHSGTLAAPAHAVQFYVRKYFCSNLPMLTNIPSAVKVIVIVDGAWSECIDFWLAVQKLTEAFIPLVVVMVIVGTLAASARAVQFYVR